MSDSNDKPSNLNPPSPSKESSEKTALEEILPEQDSYEVIQQSDMNTAGEGIPGPSGLCANNPGNDDPPRGSISEDEQHEDNSRNNTNDTDDRHQENNDRENDSNQQNDAAVESQTNCMQCCKRGICCCIIEHLRAPTNPPRNEDIDCTKLCTGGPRGYWLLAAVFIALVSFLLIILTARQAKFPVWDLKIVWCSNHSTYDLDKVSCIYPNETDFFTQERVDKFVNVLHSIILNEGCNDGLQDKFNIATKFHGQYPEIKNYTILNDLIRIHKFDIKNATKLIRLCRLHFRSSNRDLVHPVGDDGDGFIYMYDDLMKYCSYTSDWSNNVWISVKAFALVHTIIVILRALGRNYKWPCKVISEIQQFRQVA